MFPYLAHSYLIFLFSIIKVDVELKHCFTSVSHVTMHVSVHDTINQFTDVYI